MILHIINFSGPLGGLKIGQYHIKWTTYSKFQSLKEGLLTNWNLIKRSRFLPRKKLLDLHVKVIVPSLTYALPISGCATNKDEFNVRNLYIAEPLSSAEAPAGYPSKNSNTSCPPRFLFLSPSLPVTQRGPSGRERGIGAKVTYKLPRDLPSLHVQKTVKPLD